jgi:hypothetical protein
MIISADTNEFIPHKKRILDSSKVENGDVIMEIPHKKHSINQPPNKPIINGEIKEIIFFINCTSSFCFAFILYHKTSSIATIQTFFTMTLVVRVNLYNTLAAAKYNKNSKERIYYQTPAVRTTHSTRETTGTSNANEQKIWWWKPYI